MHIHVAGRRALMAMAFGLCTAGAAADARADAIADFYKGKPVKVIIGFSAGGGYDLYARTVGRHMGRHLPGNPTFVAQNMTGAGSRKAANWLYNVAPKDGATVATIGENTAIDQALKQPGVQFDVAKFNWIGNSIADNNITIVAASTGIVTIEDVLAKGGLICGGTGASSPSILSPQIINNLTGAKIRIIAGYPGGSAVNLALERGEVNCRGTNSWASQKATLGHWLKERRINVLVQWGLKKNPEISEYQGRDVPLSSELGKTDADRAALRLLASGSAIGRPIVAPPGVPADRVKALRAAFDATMTDPKFRAEAERQKMDLAPLPGEEVQRLAVETISAPEPVVTRALELVARRDIEKLKGSEKKKKKKKKE